MQIVKKPKNNRIFCVESWDYSIKIYVSHEIQPASERNFHADFRNFHEPDIQQLDCLEAQTRLYPRLFPAAHVAELADALGSGPSPGNRVQVRLLSWAPILPLG